MNLRQSERLCVASHPWMLRFLFSCVFQIPIHDPEVPVFDIIQPVLQYPADGGYYWSVKSWSVLSFTPFPLSLQPRSWSHPHAGH